MIYTNVEKFVNDAKENIKIIHVGSLRFFGDWFGRPMDNFHIPVKIDLFNSILTITFDDSYTVIVHNPKDIFVEENHFYIKSADLVRYEYGFYGSPNEPKRRFLQYKNDNTKIIKNSGIIGVDTVGFMNLQKGNFAFEIC